MNKYRMLYRPASFCTLPRGLKWDYVEAPANVNRPDLPRSRHPFGVIRTERPLTKDECETFEIVHAD
jgi:hypothetical protein